MATPQFTTRRGAGGRLETIPEAEQAELRAAWEAKQAKPTAADFIQQGPEEVSPLPEPSPQPAPPQQEGGDEETAAAASGIGGLIGGPAGAVVGGIAGFAASKLTQPSNRPIGTLEGTSVRQGGDDTLRQLLEVQREIARIGSPIKGAVDTVASNSRL